MKTQTAYAYRIGPIDRWEGWRTAQDLLSEYWSNPDYWDTPRDNLSTIASMSVSLTEQLDAAMEAFKAINWEGDVRQGSPYFIPVPAASYGEYDDAYIIAIKQNNNGSVFIWSPVELPWLEDEWV